jgi:thiamine-phosphate pyrophosphorylase
LPERALKIPLTDGMFKGPRSNSPHGLVTAAAHSRRAIVAAARAGVDAVLISPVFSTRSHPDGSTLGVTRFAALARFARSLGLGVYALGGITDATKIRRLNQSGATGIAGIDIFIEKNQA